MVAWAKLNSTPARVVDAGSGSGRFLLAASNAFPKASLVGIEIDPVAALLLRANIAAAGLRQRAHVWTADFRQAALATAPEGGQTLFIGNPPYVRHHLIAARWKEWLSRTAEGRGISASQLAGLHIHFFFRIAELAKPGDKGVLITAAEWLDVNYGSSVRELLLRDLGGVSIHRVEPTASIFPDAATTAAITTFDVGALRPCLRLKRVEKVADLGVLAGGKPVRRERLETAKRWGAFFRPTKRAPEGFVELGEFFSVHRGQVTGANRVWIEGPHSRDLPERTLFPTVTKARDILTVGRVLTDSSSLRRVIDLPVDLNEFDAGERKRIENFLRFAKKQGADSGFIARHRKAWWAVGLRNPAAILTSYMARRAPAFVLNDAAARHINIAHGLYPREAISRLVLEQLRDFLATAVSRDDGRTYAGGLTKFEPREVERLLIPDPRQMSSMDVRK